MFSDTVHGFDIAEYRARVERAQSLMAEAGLDGLLLTSMDNIRYFAGIDSTFWESYTRPWFVLLPADGEPIAIVPDIGRGLMGQTWFKEIRSWLSPCPEDEGTSLVAAAISDLKRRSGRVGAEMGADLRLMMPAGQFDDLRKVLSGVHIVDGSPVIWRLRMIKSATEISRIQRAIDVAGAVYAELPILVAIGDSERKIDRLVRMKLIEHGADAVPVLICRAGPGGTVDIQGGPRDRQLAEGDVLFVDTGTTYDGYYCDYDRNYLVGKGSDALLFAQERIWQANEAGLRAARAGMKASSVFQQMATALSSTGAEPNSNGRMGHGLGLRVTEPPSIRMEDETVLEPGMVLCIEPGIEYEPGKLLLHEETVLITEDGCRLLTRRAPQVLASL